MANNPVSHITQEQLNTLLDDFEDVLKPHEESESEFFKAWVEGMLHSVDKLRDIDLHRADKYLRKVRDQDLNITKRPEFNVEPFLDVFEQLNTKLAAFFTNDPDNENKI